MADTTFTSGTTIASSWLNDVNDAVYSGRSFSGKIIRANDPQYGIVGNGVTDDSAALATFLSNITTGTRVELCGLTIKVSSNTYIQNLSNFEIDGQGATIIAANGMAVASGKELLSFRSCTDFTVKNLKVDGNRANRTPVEVAAHNIEFRSCQRFIVEQVRSNNAVVDGFILNTATPTDSATFVRYGYFIDCTTDNCYRQGMSIINGYNIVVSGGAYNNTTGTSPQSGIDIEANAGAATPGNDNILIQGARFSGNVGRGIITSSVSTGVDIWIDGCSFDGNTDGAITASATGTVISKCSFRGHTASVQGVVRFPSTTPAVTAGIIRDCVFSGNTAAVPCVYLHSSTLNVSVLDNKILDHLNAGGVSVSGQDHKISGNYINSAGGVGVTIGSGAIDAVVSNNVIVGASTRAIYAVGSTRTKIIGNTCRDVVSVSGAYIQVDDADAFVDDNACISTTAATTTFAIRITNVAARSVSGNTFVNLHSTDPITITGSGLIRRRMNNQGGTSNPGDLSNGRYLQTDAFTVATLGAAGTYPRARATVTDSSVAAAGNFGAVVAGGGANIVPVYSDGTNWRIG